MNNSTPSSPWVGRNDALILKTLADTDWFERVILPHLDGYPDPGRCWLWTRSTARGHGQAKLPTAVVGPGRAVGVKVNRVVWLALRGPLGAGEFVANVEDCEPRCANPAHHRALVSADLCRLATNQSLTARALRRTHCPQGHELVGENIIPTLAARGWRGCAICHRERYLTLKRAREMLGLTQMEYASRFGYSHVVAERILAGEEANS